MSGDECLVFDYQNKLIGRGVYNSVSLYRVRVLARPNDSIFELPMTEIIASRVRNALSLRRELGLGNEDNSAYRLLNGEGDFLSGVVADVYNNIIVVECSALWGEVHRSSIELALKLEIPFVDTIVWRSKTKRLELDGWVPVESIPKNRADIGVTTGVDIQENGIMFRVFPGVGQKTGFYCDQRDNRLLLRSLSAGIHPPYFNYQSIYQCGHQVLIYTNKL